MDRVDRFRIPIVPRIGNLCGIVLRRTVVYDQYLDVSLTVFECEDRLQAFVHVIRRIETRNDKRDCFHAFPLRRRTFGTDTQTGTIVPTYRSPTTSVHQLRQNEHLVAPSYLADGSPEFIGAPPRTCTCTCLTTCWASSPLLTMTRYPPSAMPLASATLRTAPNR